VQKERSSANCVVAVGNYVDFDARVSGRVESIPVGNNERVLHFFGDCVKDAFCALADEEMLSLLNHLK